MDSTDHNPSTNAKEPEDSTWQNRSSLIDRLSSPNATTLSNKNLSSKPTDKAVTTKASNNQNIRQHFKTNREAHETVQQRALSK
ncbi:uncharacterized protein PGTG_21712 [Puccinia graminis f. sp. tritici CRL 75-36-700-3]|uniref:Uncharacterized protein n=1 Tax=Puccinia graminis f. sp. tritici (strain CRL 75-36-700-3 / race SCCL) TaxID=418459 RepID=H6QS95_PUCGT|nr:uncharacterized protein PGTG_21712 [Puccinia graminis f. sp. tritici CRL 75-36-700-3]EHS63619.1 hypothetical protein PGTG_21712 [Puccinia graminis f. sp. tritici CRL 75-36-700-3]